MDLEKEYQEAREILTKLEERYIDIQKRIIFQKGQISLLEKLKSTQSQPETQEEPDS